jgi:hypothetical protein
LGQFFGYLRQTVCRLCAATTVEDDPKRRWGLALIRKRHAYSINSNSERALQARRASLGFLKPLLGPRRTGCQLVRSTGSGRTEEQIARPLGADRGNGEQCR